MPEAMAGAPVQHAENREAGEAGKTPETPETPDQGHACAARAGEPSPSVHQLRVADTPAGLLPPARGSSHPLVRGLEALLEPLATALSLWAVAGWQEGRVTPAWLLVSVLAFALCYPARPLLHVSPLPATLSLLAGWAWVAGLLLLVGMATGWLARLPALVWQHWLWAAPLAQWLTQAALRWGAPHLVRLQGPPLRAVVAGLNTQGLALADRLRDAEGAPHGAGIVLEGCFDDRADPRMAGPHRHQLLGRLADIGPYVKRRRIQLIYLCLPMASQPRVRELLQALQDTTASVYFVPDLLVTEWIHGRTGAVCGLPVISVCDTPLRGLAGVAKRGGDLVLASALLVLLMPLMGLIALAIRLDSPGPVLFRQRRYGLDGEEITVYKFRSMRVAEDGPDVPQARRNDPRVTRIGAWLRRLSLDELPQLVNVLQGRMSLVGPRPHAVAHNEMYRQQIRSYMVRHKVRPGITGWAQVNGFRGETDSLEKMEGRIRLDIDYLRRWSPWLDLYILLRTVRVLMGDSRAY